MDNDKQKKVATILAICVFVLGLGFILAESEDIYHYRVDESPGPEYVVYDRTPLESAGIAVTWIMGAGVIAILIYFMASPTS